MSAVIEETFNKVNTHKGIEGIILSDSEGVPIKSTFNEDEKTYFYTTSASMFVKKCRNVVKELIEEDLTFIRIRTTLCLTFMLASVRVMIKRMIS